MDKTAAADFKPGDTVRYNAQTDWKLVKKLHETESTVTWSFEYTRCDFAPARVGDIWTHRFRKTTKLTLD